MENKKFSIVFVTNQLIYGGAERYTISVANQLHSKGCKVAVISSGGPMQKLLNKNIHHYYAPVKKTDLISRLRTALTIISTSWKIRAQLIHTQSAQGAFSAKMAKMISRVPVIKTAHGYPDGVIPSIAKSLNFTTDKVVMISDWLSRRMTSFGLRKDKAKTILNGIDVKEFASVNINKEKMRKKFGLNKKENVVVSIARVIPEKKLEELVSWFPYVLAKKPDTKLLIVGDGGSGGDWYRDKLIQQVKDSDLNKSIKILRGTHEVAEILSIADVFCIPSVGKGFAVLEAMAAGLPVVARRPRGIEDTVKDGINGFLFSARDWKAMVDRVVFLLENKKISHELGRQGKLLVQSHFTLEQMIYKLEEVYSKSLSKTSLRSNISLAQKQHSFASESKFKSNFS
jgi:glycosyltransferase involved in cell wall biosynthesis